MRIQGYLGAEPTVVFQPPADADLVSHAMTLHVAKPSPPSLSRTTVGAWPRGGPIEPTPQATRRITIRHSATAGTITKLLALCNEVCTYGLPRPPPAYIAPVLARRVAARVLTSGYAGAVARQFRTHRNLDDPETKWRAAGNDLAAGHVYRTDLESWIRLAGGHT